MDKVVSSSNKTSVDIIKYGIKNSILSINIKDLDSFILKPLAEMAYVIRIAEKIDNSIAIVVYLLNISNNQRNIGYDNGIFDDSYLLLIDWLKYLYNNFSTISINMGVEVLEYNKFIKRFLKIHNKVFL